jgi:hypothetical protein
VSVERGFFATIIGDGIPLLVAVGAALVFAGGFAVFIAATGDFLPHDVDYLGMTADQLCEKHGCRIVDFMIHDRVAWGGALAAIGVQFVWLAVFPLKRGAGWAWWTLVVAGGFGFASFLTYLSYGYLDSWHALGTVILLPVFLVGLVRSRRVITHETSLLSLREPAPLGRGSRYELGRLVLLAGAAGTMVGGLSIAFVGVSDVFVPEDLAFMQVATRDLDRISERLVSLIAHDRNGFGGAVFVTGLTCFLCLWKEGLPTHLWEAVASAGMLSLSCAIGIHFVVGYTDLLHLGPAVAAAVSLVVGLGLSVPGRNIAPLTPA